MRMVRIATHTLSIWYTKLYHTHMVHTIRIWYVPYVYGIKYAYGTEQLYVIIQTLSVILLPYCKKYRYRTKFGGW